MGNSYHPYIIMTLDKFDIQEELDINKKMFKNNIVMKTDNKIAIHKPFSDIS